MRTRFLPRRPAPVSPHSPIIVGKKGMQCRSPMVQQADGSLILQRPVGKKALAALKAPPILSSMPTLADPVLSTIPATSTLDEGVDRKRLRQIKQRFMGVNQARLLRARSGLDARQLVFVVMADATPDGGQWGPRAAIDSFVTALSGCGCG